MKQERIDELLKGSGYDVKSPVWGEDNRDQIYKDATLNAARVQLLAKALRFYAECQKGDIRLGFHEKGHINKPLDIGATARAALSEAGITQEKVG
jgi:hypothetical protein